MESSPRLSDVFIARRRLHGRVRNTPLRPSSALSQQLGCEIGLKLECLQTTGSFKLRGATHALLQLEPAARARGVITMSTGNHGRAIAYAAGQMGMRAVICMSRLVPSNKVEAIRALGAEVVIHGASQDEAAGEVMHRAEAEGLSLIPPFDHPDVIAGQGTIGLEIMLAQPQTDTVLVPMSGGGLLAGVAMAVKSIAPHARVIGVSMEQGAALHASLTAGRPIEVEEVPTLADSLGGGIGLSNRHTFSMVQRWVDDTVLVSEDEIAQAMRYAYGHEQLVIEGAAAVGIAALCSGRVRPGSQTVLLVTGSNVDMAAHHRIVTIS